METPLLPDSDGEFCWELDVEPEFRLEERHVFYGCMEIAAAVAIQTSWCTSYFPPFNVK